jgi:hypothetical protein
LVLKILTYFPKEEKRRMKAKKILSLALAVIFAFAPVVGAADYNRTDPANVDCTNCPKCPLANIPCPGTVVIPGPQGTSTTVSESAYPFDFDGTPAVTGGFGSYGYCSGYNYADDPTRNCKFIFDLCTCDQACQLVPGQKMGIQMYIKTPGVYFADPTMTTVNFGIWQDVNTLCANTADKEPAVTVMQPAPYYIGATSGNRISGDFAIDKEEIAETGSEIRNFGLIKYYRTFSETLYNSKGKFESAVSNEGLPLAGALTTSVPVANRVVALQSEYETDYVITKNDAGGQCKLWIDIPAMRVDPSVPKGTVVQVQVRLLFNRLVSGVCPECEPPDVCDCTLDVGVVCCDVTVDPTTGEYCMYFPYMVQGIELSAGWASGLAITSRNTLPDDARLTFTMTDSAGNVATYINNDVNKIWTSMVENIMPNFTGATLVPGAVSLKVSSNYSMDGYSFLTNGTGMVGTLARGCNANQCAP